jgi:FMN phosphatase YigB (HAD superfamily)
MAGIRSSEWIPSVYPAMVKAVLFDLFETLVTESWTQPTRASSVGDALGLEGEAFRVEWKARRPRVVLGRLSFGDALTEISRTLIGSVDTAAVERVCEQRIREKAIAFAATDEEVSALISQLRGQRLSLAVVSNCFAEDVSAWPTWPLAREFQCSVFSFEARVAKPDPEIYLKATAHWALHQRQPFSSATAGTASLSVLSAPVFVHSALIGF